MIHDSQLVMQVCIPSAEAPSRVVVSVYLPETYPSSSPPVVELHGSAISADQQAEAIQHLDEIFQPGEVSQIACVGSDVLLWQHHKVLRTLLRRTCILAAADSKMLLVHAHSACRHDRCDETEDARIQR